MLLISYLVLHFLRPVLSDLQLQLFEHGPWLIVIGEKDSVFLGLHCTEVKVLKQDIVSESADGNAELFWRFL